MTERDPAYRRWIAECACVVCSKGAVEKTNAVVCQAAHVRIGGAGGMGLKPSDYRCLPLCWQHHDLQHHVGERNFWPGVGLDPEKLILAFNLFYRVEGL